MRTRRRSRRSHRHLHWELSGTGDQPQSLRSSSGSLAMLAAMRRASAALGRVPLTRLTGPTSCLDIASLRSRFLKRPETRRVAVSSTAYQMGGVMNCTALSRPTIRARQRDRAVANYPAGFQSRWRGLGEGTNRSGR
jgi:hypothetical protein